MNNSQPIVSVCVQTYNQVDYIKQCLDGILMQQTNFPFEVILGEDESVDGTRELCIDYAKRNPEVINLQLCSRKDVIYINGQATGRYNFMENLKLCRGKYIALCEGDDYWTDPLKLQKQVDFLESNPDYNICFHNITIYDQNEKTLKEDYLTMEIDEETTILDLAKCNYIHTPSVVIRNDFKMPKWFARSPIGDWTLYMLLIDDKKIKRLDERMAVYRVHASSLWSKLNQNKRERGTYISVQLVFRHIRGMHISVKRLLINRLIDDSKRFNYRVQHWKYRLINKLIDIKYFV